MSAPCNRALLATALAGMQLLSLCSVALCVSQVVLAEEHATQTLDLKDFGKFTVEASKFVGKSADGMTDMTAAHAGRQIESIIRGRLKRWSADGVLRGKYTLAIHPEIIELRIAGGSALPRNSRFTLRLRLINTDTGEIVGLPEFSDDANAFAVAFTRGRADNGMLTRVTQLACDYLDSNYDAAVAEVSRTREEAVARWRATAEQGDATAQLTLGSMHSTGQDVKQDDGEAVAWWRKAAEQGNADAQINLGWAYANGRGVAQDDKTAVEWWRMAAQRGNAQAQHKLGWMYDNGRGVARSETEALAWYRKAADQGDATAKSYVARKERGTTRFSSFDDARAALNPEDGRDVELMTNPMSLKGRILAVRLEVVQILGNGEMLVTNPYLGVPQLDGKIYYAHIPATYVGSREFVDGQQVAVVGEVTGSHQYTTAIGTSKTVPKLVIYGIRAGH